MKIRLFSLHLCFLLMAHIVYSNDIQFTEKLLTKCIQDCANSEMSDLIGWSNDGKIAFVDFYSDAVPTGYSDIYFVIEDLETNSYIFKEFCGRVENGPVIDSTQFGRITKILSKNKIFYAPTNPQQFPIFYNADTISIETQEETTSTTTYNVEMGPFDTISVSDFEIIIRLRKINSGLIKKIQLNLTGSHYFGEWNQTIFYYQSPYNDWIAIPYYYSDPYSAADIDITGIFRGENGMVGCNLDAGFIKETDKE